MYMYMHYAPVHLYDSAATDDWSQMNSFHFNH